jgi:hypothetical protein
MLFWSSKQASRWRKEYTDILGYYSTVGNGTKPDQKPDDEMKAEADFL